MTYHFFQGIIVHRDLVDTLRKRVDNHDAQLSHLIRRLVLTVLAELHANSQPLLSNYIAVMVSTYVAGNTVEMAQGLSHGAIDRVGHHVEYGMAFRADTIAELQNRGCDPKPCLYIHLAKMSSQDEARLILCLIRSTLDESKTWGLGDKRERDNLPLKVLSKYSEVSKTCNDAHCHEVPVREREARQKVTRRRRGQVCLP